jgi:hypothetical protein
MAPFESQRQWRRVGCGRLDCEFRRQSAGRARFETGYPYLRGVTSGAEWSSVFDTCAALIASMFHWVSSYSSGLLGRKKVGQCRRPRGQPIETGERRLDVAFLTANSYPDDGEIRTLALGIYRNDVLVVFGADL